MAEIHADSNAQRPWPESVTRTADPDVDAVISRLAGLARMPTSEHIAVYDAIHEQLRQELDAEPDGGAGPRSGVGEGGD
ncbi:hypothetical protein [Arthrobacter sp. H14-L1]|uniref:hypothetical protein n=1 Tax=Arthrobacter sp. H14-L1 TaxID=2996697 RepID=UPI002271438A|nr:hypothetical protein [Arthrobacter sp. H14-L1]MCY0906434.1 hypothetical protein [Arthrobacter sp. H14-L1]